MRRVYVKLTRDELVRLQELAAKHRRHASAEAAELLAEAMQSIEQKQDADRQEVPA